MEEGIGETKGKELVPKISHPPLPREPYTWLMIIDGAYGERQTFYSLAEDRYYVRFLPEFENKYIACCNEGWLVLKDRFTDDLSILNIFTMEKLQLPPLPIDADYSFPCVMSSSKMDKSCRFIFFDGPGTFRSCNLGDSEFIERELTYNEGGITRSKNFKGKLHALTFPGYNLVASDFSDPGLQQEEVISGQSIADLIRSNLEQNFYLVESCEDLLLILMDGYNNEVSDVKIFRADFRSREWVKLETLGDRVVFLEFHYTFSSPASDLGLKSNAVYWVCFPHNTRHIYMYDLEDKSISMFLPCTFVGLNSSLFWLSLPKTCNEEKPLKDGISIFEASPTKRNFHLQQQKATVKCKSKIELRETHKKEESETISSTKIGIGNSWEDLLSDLLLEILSRLFAGDRAAFYCVCKSWYSVSSMATAQRSGPPLKISDCSSPFLLCADNKILHPIYGKVHGMDLPDIPGANVRAARDGWLLMDEYSHRLFFYNPLTKAKVRPPDCGARFYYSLYFSAPPTSADLLIVAAVRRWDGNEAICYIKHGEPSWTSHEIVMHDEYSYFSFCNAVVYNRLYYFLGSCSDLIIYDPTEDKISFYDAPEYVSWSIGEHFLLESDGNLIAVFVDMEGNSTDTYQWNFVQNIWEMLGSLGNRMLFVSRPLSLCREATVSGTGNKIYFSKIVGDDQILFYSLATKMYHTFEMGTSYWDFFGSKIYPQCNGCWFTP